MRRILIVDDEEALREALRTYLALEGYDTAVAASAEEAMRMDLASFDLVLLDIMMDGMSGTEMAARMKADPATAAVPVIFLTARDSDDDMWAACASAPTTTLPNPTPPAMSWPASRPCCGARAPSGGAAWSATARG